MPAFFTEDEGIFLRNVLDTMLPAAGELPSATAVNVHVFIDKFDKEVIDVEKKGPIREAMKVTVSGLMSDTGKEDISSVKSSDYETFLTKYLKKTKEEHEAIQDRIQAHIDKNGDSAAGLSEQDKIYRFLVDIRNMAIWAYQSSELVGKTILAYKPVPGEQRGCVDVEEATGGVAWALN